MPDNFKQIKHVFVLMLENRSYDHVFGFSNFSGKDTLSGEDTAAEGLTGNESNNDPGGYPIKVNRGADFIMNFDPGHDFKDVLEQLCGAGTVYSSGAYPDIFNYGFVTNYSTVDPAHMGAVMKCFTSDQLPVLDKLAREFVVCDRWFSSMPGPTWPNRFFVHAASSGGLDDSPGGLAELGAVVQIDPYTFSNGTIYDKFADGETQIYRCGSIAQSQAIGGLDNFRSIDYFSPDLNSGAFSKKYIFIEPSYDFLNKYKNGNSQHPLNDIKKGERLVQNIYETIRNSPVWPNSLLIITYDEHGGFYDHFKPPAAVPPGDEPTVISKNNFSFIQLGVRVPALIISPLIKKNLIDHTIYDHSSILATVEKIFDLQPLTDRDRTAENFTYLFSLDTPREDCPAHLFEGVAGAMIAAPAVEMRVTEKNEVDTTVAHYMDASTNGFLNILIKAYLDRHKDKTIADVRKEYNNLVTNQDVQKFIADNNLW